MKVICIDNKNLENQLTINRVYEVDDMTCHDVGDFVFHFVFIKNDKFKYKEYLKDRFFTLPEYRNDKINKLLE